MFEISGVPLSYIAGFVGWVKTMYLLDSVQWLLYSTSAESYIVCSSIALMANLVPMLKSIELSTSMFCNSF